MAFLDEYYLTDYPLPMHVRFRSFLVVTLLITAAAAFGENGNGERIDIDFSMNGSSAESLHVRAGLDIEEFLGLGLSWKLGFAAIESQPVKELTVGIWFGALLFRQDELIPLSIIIRGSFDKSRFVGPYLEAENLMRSASGFSLGAGISRRFALSETWTLETGIAGSYEYSTYTTEAVAGSGSPFETRIEAIADYLYGIDAKLGYGFNEKNAMGFGFSLRLNSALEILYGPSISLSAK